MKVYTTSALLAAVALQSAVSRHEIILSARSTG